MGLKLFHTDMLDLGSIAPILDWDGINFPLNPKWKLKLIQYNI